MRADPRSGHDLRGERVAGVQAGIEALRHETKSEVAKVEAGIEAHRQETKAGTAAPKAQLVKWAFGVMQDQFVLSKNLRRNKRLGPILDLPAQMG